ncbi:LPP20 family lipoprotein [Nitrospira sp. Kam-Ns4a]
MKPGHVLLGALLLLAACTSRTPAWVTGKSPDYPAADYLLGVGQADSRPAAEQEAYAAVSRIFKAEVTAQARDWESYFQLETRGTANIERRITLDKVTHVSTEKVLENVRILDRWYDKASSQHYALAGMNRPQAATALLERLAEMDQRIEDELRESRQATDKLIKLRSLKRAIGHLVLREALNTDLRIIRPSGRGEEPRYRVGELTAELEQFLAANLAIGVEITGDQAEVVQNALMEGLLREGLPVTARRPGPGNGPAESPEGRAPELMVRGSVRVWPANVPDPQFKYVRWCSDLVIEEVSTRRVVAAIARGGREGHLTEREALAKAVRIMQKELTSDLAKTLAGYVYGEAEPAGAVPPSACPDGQAQPGQAGPPRQAL